MTLQSINKGCFVNIGEPPATELYLVLTQPDNGRYCQVMNIETCVEHTVYLGRWATLATEEQLR